MRASVPPLCVLAAALMAWGTAIAQIAAPFYVNTDYRFAVIFPGEPQAKDITFRTSFGDAFPARQFSLEQNANRHTVTVVDVSAGLAVDWNLVEHAAEDLRQRGEVKFSAEDDYDPGLPGRQLNILQSDGRQLRASVYMWDHRLYITEADGELGATSLIQFEQSITLLNADGSEVNLGR